MIHQINLKIHWPIINQTKQDISKIKQTNDLNQTAGDVQYCIEYITNVSNPTNECISIQNI